MDPNQVEPKFEAQGRVVTTAINEVALPEYPGYGQIRVPRRANIDLGVSRPRPRDTGVVGTR